MRGIVAYDTVHGSTKKVAETLAEEIRDQGHQVELMAIREGFTGKITGDFLLIGSPTRGGVMTKETKRFVDELDVTHWKGKPIVAFDTLGPLFVKDPEKRKSMLDGIDDDKMKNAANSIRMSLVERGLGCRAVMHFAVSGLWGPLSPDMPERAKSLAQRFLASLG